MLGRSHQHDGVDIFIGAHVRQRRGRFQRSVLSPQSIEQVRFGLANSVEMSELVNVPDKILTPVATADHTNVHFGDLQGI